MLVRSRAGGPLPVSFAFFDGGGRWCGLQTFVEFLNNMSTLQYQLLNHGRIKHKRQVKICSLTENDKFCLQGTSTSFT